jgi:hypothetical protein
MTSSGDMKGSFVATFIGARIVPLLGWSWIRLALVGSIAKGTIGKPHLGTIGTNELSTPGLNHFMSNPSMSHNDILGHLTVVSEEEAVWGQDTGSLFGAPETG